MTKTRQEIVSAIRKEIIKDFLDYLKDRELSICHYKEGTANEIGMYMPISTEAIAEYATKFSHESRPKYES